MASLRVEPLVDSQLYFHITTIGDNWILGRLGSCYPTIQSHTLFDPRSRDSPVPFGIFDEHVLVGHYAAGC